MDRLCFIFVLTHCACNYSGNKASFTFRYHNIYLFAHRLHTETITEWIMFCLLFSLLCKSSNDRTDYAELLFPQRHPKPNASLPQNNSQQLNRSLPESQEDGIPPALPYRPTNLHNSPAQFPSSQPNRLYPNLKEEYPQKVSPLPATKVILTSKCFSFFLFSWILLNI